MGFLDIPLRVKLDGDEWIDVRRVSAPEFRAMQKDAKQAEPEFEGDDKGTAENFRILAWARSQILAWSDPAPITPENLDRLPLDINAHLIEAISAGSMSEVPLQTTSISNESSEDEME